MFISKAEKVVLFTVSQLLCTDTFAALCIDTFAAINVSKK